MTEMYEFLAGPGVWISFFIFIGGLMVRTVYLFGVSQERDRVFYNHADWKWGARSIFHWLLPLGSVSLREQPFFGAAFFVFHVCLFAVPLFLLAHNTLLHEAFGVALPSLPDSVSDILTVVFLAAGLILLARRLARPEVRILTSAWDYFLLVFTCLPFVTGFLAFHQLGPYPTMLVAHIACAEALLVIIPFTKLAHVVLFFFSRAFIGFEMGTRRGARTW
jgi:nitrate reductase gamma subunit